MLAVKTFALGAVGIAALVGGTAPASAQYFPGSPYGHGWGQPSAGQVIGQVIAQVLNPYGHWGYQRGVNPQMAVNQCSRAVQHRLQSRHQAGWGHPYNPYGYDSQFNQARVLGITRIDQRSATTMRVIGVATSGMMSHGQWGQWGGGGFGHGWGGHAQAQADLSFRCDVDFRGHVRNVSIQRNF